MPLPVMRSPLDPYVFMRDGRPDPTPNAWTIYRPVLQELTGEEERRLREAAQRVPKQTWCLRRRG